ncbi:hypothetical protein [uncultured Tateyamaria sp.]|uniref:hypothetical protein n=1 Tax=uncultured Tateyamaria sp. TaxID=455651 RepID=UPI00260B5D19|nr:hypothetical protein [uncultured Tateyamaria sp.]
MSSLPVALQTAFGVKVQADAPLNKSLHVDGELLLRHHQERTLDHLAAFSTMGSTATFAAGWTNGGSKMTVLRCVGHQLVRCGQTRPTDLAIERPLIAKTCLWHASEHASGS